VFMYSTKKKTANAQATAPVVQRHAISAQVSEGLRKAARKPSTVGDGFGIAARQ
jgi:hypothetical protein